MEGERREREREKERRKERKTNSIVVYSETRMIWRESRNKLLPIMIF